jgi:O-antigen/teichoic acid export membrane protein
MQLISTIVQTGTAQALLQLLGFVGGLLVVRWLSMPEYAIYTMMTAGLGTLTALADAGVTSSVMAQAGNVHSQREHVGRVIVAGLRFRARLALVVALLATPPLFWLFRDHGLGTGGALGTIAVVLVAFVPAVTTSILEVPLKLEQALRPLQWLQLQAAAARVALTAGLVSWLPIAVVAMLASAAVQWWSNLRLRGLLASWRLRDLEPDRVAVAGLRHAVRRTMPGTLYLCVASQLNVWLLAVFGTTVSVGQIGALGRLAMIFNVVNALVALIAVPRFARLPRDWPRLRYFYLRVAAALAAMGAAAAAIVWLFPEEALWVLGSQYDTLRSEVVLMMVSGALGLAATSLTGLNTARGYMPPGYVHPLLGITHTIPLLWLLDVSTVGGVLWMQMILAGFSAFYATLTFLYYARRPHEPVRQAP